MSKLLLGSLALAVLAVANQANAAVVTVTPADMSAGPTLNQWYVANLRTLGGGNPLWTSVTTGAITSTNPRSGNGSVEMSQTDGSGKVDFVYNWGFVNGRTLGQLDALSFDSYRSSSSTAAPHLQPAMRLAYDADGNSATAGDQGYLIWEPIYNGGATSVDSWNVNNIFGDNFWQRQPGYTVEKFDMTLNEWINGVDPADADQLNADSAILGIEFGIGSGWAGTFTGFVDNVTFGFDGASTTFNFETAAAADVPEPASALLVGLGLLGFAAARRRNQM